MSKALIVATVVKQHIMEFHRPTIKMLSENGWTVDVAAHNDYEKPLDCVIPFCSRYYDLPFTRSPISFGNIKAYRQLKEILRSGDYDVVHCHTPSGALVGRLAAKGFRKKGLKVYYTAHGFHFYKGAPLKNWLFYFPPEWFCAHWTDVLFTINKEDYAFAKKHLPAKRVEYIPGVGIDIEKFANTMVDRAAKRKEIGIPEDALMILSVGELNKNKNHEAVIKAMAECINHKKIIWPLSEEHLNSELHYAIAGRGELHDYLQNLADNLGIGDRLHLLGYRNDVAELYKTADLFVLPSLREGLNVSLMEARASGLECRCFPIRGNTEIVEAEDMSTFGVDSVNSMLRRMCYDS